jgi:hypothetical protein
VKAIGVCKLCLEQKPLRRSHYLPAGLYGKKHKEFEFQTYYAAGKSEKQIMQYLLCDDCEQLLSARGESHVLNVLRPRDKVFSLNDRMQVAWSRDGDPSCPRFDARDFDLDMDQFAHFAMGIVWRGMITTWTMFDGNETHKLPILGNQDEEIRRYLLGKAEFPAHIAIIVIVCKDDESRKTLFVPTPFVESGCVNIAFTLRGIHFRLMMGQIPAFYRYNSCTSPHRPIFHGDAKHKTEGGFATIAAIRARAPWLQVDDEQESVEVI